LLFLAKQLKINKREIVLFVPRRSTPEGLRYTVRAIEGFPSGTLTAGKEVLPSTKCTLFIVIREKPFN
jgi:hypothetical protein